MNDKLPDLEINNLSSETLQKVDRTDNSLIHIKTKKVEIKPITKDEINDIRSAIKDVIK